MNEYHEDKHLPIKKRRRISSYTAFKWEELPYELRLYIMENYLSGEDLAKLEMVSKDFRMSDHSERLYRRMCTSRIVYRFDRLVIPEIYHKFLYRVETSDAKQSMIYLPYFMDTMTGLSILMRHLVGFLWDEIPSYFSSTGDYTPPDSQEFLYFNEKSFYVEHTYKGLLRFTMYRYDCPLGFLQPIEYDCEFLKEECDNNISDSILLKTVMESILNKIHIVEMRL
jgi:hypothetical protein